MKTDFKFLYYIKNASFSVDQNLARLKFLQEQAETGWKVLHY